MNLELEREHTVQALCHHFAQDQLTTEELDARIEAAYRARTAEELRALLPAVPAVQHGGVPVAGAPAADAPARRMVSIFGEVKRRGEWELAPLTRAVVVCGTLELDLREARIRPLSIIDVTATFAEVRIIVPPGVAVECDCASVLAEVTEPQGLDVATAPDWPTVRVTGFAVLSEVSIQTRFPGESDKDARQRLKAGKRAAKRD